MAKTISDRIGKVQSEFIGMILKADFKDAYREDLRDYVLLHSSSCAQLAKILAIKRKLNVELSAIIGLIHDIGKIACGRKEGHAREGYMPARELLKKVGGFSEEEIDIISNAVKNHSSKDEVGSWADEIAKDVDLIDCDLTGKKFDKESYNKRIEKSRKEMGI